MDERALDLFNTRFDYTKEKLAELEEEIDTKTKQGALIRAAYDAAFGELVLERDELLYSCHYLNKRISYIKESINRGHFVSSAQVDMQFAELKQDYQEKLDKYRSDVEASKLYLASEDVDYNEKGLIHEHYMNIIYKIHPDLHAYTSPTDMNAFRRAQLSFIANDLIALIEIDSTTVNNNEHLTFKEKNVLLDKMERLIRSKEIKLEWLPIKPPFDKEELIHDENLMNEEKTKIEDQIKQFTMIKEQLTHIANTIVLKTDA